MELTHASFFSGVGGLDRGLERAGFRTVSFSEIDPYASAVLAERWPGIPNLGDITLVAGPVGGAAGEAGRDAGTGQRSRLDRGGWQHAILWTGGFPCQDLSVAGKRRGFGLQHDGRKSQPGLRAIESQPAGGQRLGDTVGSLSPDRGDTGTSDGTRSGLAFAFLDLVERYRPPAIVLENVPGLLSSHKGRDFYALQRRMAQLGYVGAYRVLDARHFGVPQRRRRVFIVALDTGRGFGPDSAAEVLSVGSRCRRHPPAGTEEGSRLTERIEQRPTRSLTLSGNDEEAGYGPLIPTLTDPERLRYDAAYILGSPPDAGRVRAPDGLAGRLDDSGGLELSPTLRVGPAHIEDGGPGDTVPIVVGTIRSGHHGYNGLDDISRLTVLGAVSEPDPLLPLGLDSHRYRCCGNGVVSSVPEWFGQRLAALLSVAVPVPVDPW